MNTFKRLLFSLWTEWMLVLIILAVITIAAPKFLTLLVWGMVCVELGRDIWERWQRYGSEEEE